MAPVLQWLSRLQTEHPWRVLAVALASVLVAGLFASRLTLKTSFGVAAAAGEICCVIAGVLVLPAGLLWLAQRRAARRARATAAPLSAER